MEKNSRYINLQEVFQKHFYVTNFILQGFELYLILPDCDPSKEGNGFRCMMRQ
jgi:hypothetical protein